VNTTFRKVSLLAIVLVQAILLSNCGSSSTSTEMSPSAVSVSVSSQSTSAVVGQTVQFTATVTGSSNTSVTWSVNGVASGNSSVGTITSSGMYTAPAVPPSPNTVAVQATSVADTAKMASLTLTISNPAPQLSSISPAAMGIGGSNSAQVPATGTMLTLNGAGFTSQSAVIANATSLATTFVSASQLTATVPASLVASPGVLQLTVSTPAPGGGTTSSLSFTVLSVGQVSGTNNLQVAQYSITPPRDANVTIQFGLDTTYGLATWSQPTPTGGGAVSLLVAGMRAFTTYHMRAAVNFPDGTQYLDSDQTFTTGGLPSARVPQVTVTGASPSGGVELLDLFNLGGSAPGSSLPIQAAVTDTDGNLIWYYDLQALPGQAPFPIKLLPNGHMLITISTLAVGPPSVVREIDLAGNTISEFSRDDLNQWLSAAGFQVAVSNIHHDFALLPNGHLILLVSILKDFTDLPGYPGVTSVVGDGLVDLDQNRKPVWVWSTFDHLDVNRHLQGLPDWTHGNAVVYSPTDGNLILSMRNQSWVIKINYQNGAGDGSILWRLGWEGDFVLPGAPADWFYGQHYPVFLSRTIFGVSKIALFDNGTSRVVDQNGTTCTLNVGPNPCYSRAVILSVNEERKAVQTLWQDNLAPVYSDCCGSIIEFPNGNMEFDIAFYSYIPQISQVLEVTQQESPQVVWQMDIDTQLAYRAYRIPSLYPGVQW
jgi:arylsulfate sulfotransferase